MLAFDKFCATSKRESYSNESQTALLAPLPRSKAGFLLNLLLASGQSSRGNGYDGISEVSGFSSRSGYTRMHDRKAPGLDGICT